MGILTKSKNGAFIIPGIASALLPGLGQFFKGHIMKGVVFMAIAFFWGAIVWLPSFLPLSGLWLPLLAVFLWLINVLDAAFNSVGQHN